MQDKLGLHCQRALHYGLSRVSKLTFKIRLNRGEAARCGSAMKGAR